MAVIHPVFQGTHQAKRQAQVVDTIYTVLMLLMAVVGLVLSPSAAFARRRLPSRPLVLAYASDINASGLLDSTNQQRTANGAGSLSLSSQLAQAAQNKANDMVARNYWSHDTPDGKPPWTFIANAGYGYSAAAENLAYGFLTSSDVVTGWMNSAGHRTNMLNGSYKEVGFGIANGSNYQGQGEQTVVVAFYAQPLVVTPTAPAPVTPTPAPPAPKPANTPTPTPAPSAPTTPAPTPTSPKPAPAPTPTEPVLPESPKVTTPTTPVPISTPAQNLPARGISRAQLLAVDEPWMTFGLGLIGSLAALYLVVSHSVMLHKIIRRGERFVLHHPFFDFLLLPLIIVTIFLSQTAGMIH